MKLIFLLEESSMQEFLNILLPKVLPDTVKYLLIPHSGKSDLKKSIPRKLRALQADGVHFIIVHDQDSADCKILKNDLKNLCENSKAPNSLVRIACKELEAWYWGDLISVGEAYAKDLRKYGNKAKYRISDKIENPKNELLKILPEHQQLLGARLIASAMSKDRIDNNKSVSFQIFLSGIRKIVDSSPLNT